MASKRQRQIRRSYSSDDASLEQFDSIKKLAEAGIQSDNLTYDELLSKLRRWWCHYYKRPYKDPLLDSYTFEELLYEHFDVMKETVAPPADEIPQEEYDWAAEEEAKELAEYEQLNANQIRPESDTIKPLTDEEWVKHHDVKTLHNPDVDQVDTEGGDISATFEV